MRVLAFDLASSTGYCVGDANGEGMKLGTVLLPQSGAEIGPFLDFWHQWLDMLLVRHAPDAIAYEAPFIDPKMANVTTVRKLSSLGCLLELECFRRKILVREVSNITAKKAVGSGKFKKPDLMAAAKRCGLSPANYDESDAFAVWIASLSEFAPGELRAWHSKLHGI